jgi:hypothetical protein
MSSVIKTPEWLETNTRWLEALDPSSGKVYFVDLPTQQSSWDAPEAFMDRKELSQALQKAHADLEELGSEEAFLAKVKERYPPPPTEKPPPPKPTESMLKGKGSMASMPIADGELKAENERLQRRVAELEAAAAAAAAPAQPSAAAPPPLPGLPGLAEPPPLPLSAAGAAIARRGSATAATASPRGPPQWKRGASQLPVEEPPPPPAWALAMSNGGAKAAQRGSMPARTSNAPPMLSDVSTPRRGTAPPLGSSFSGAI